MNTTLTTDRLPDVLPQNPLDLACEWFAYAQDHAAQPNPNAMSLVSIGEDGQPSVRIVLCKSFVANPGYLVFFTNYESHKGRDLIANPRAAVVMHWDALGRQIRVEGQALRSPAAESDEYFASRARGSQLGAWGSDQSRPLESRRQLLAQLRERAAGLAGETPAAIPR
ncbi:MAG: pyridoxal 5'-phosphate synthase, partial [Halioglobus sp.]|nr:pyridoxal 5'-phosphate synthase [Halioglobus sp.]